mmetsp:Transcript_15432/g.46556  ORF Transcript_15432/g.46556 Transcript_15432/m.46556 type:complete len:238 (+) Transcript_15432:988-1701(+)
MVLLWCMHQKTSTSASGSSCDAARCVFCVFSWAAEGCTTMRDRPKNGKPSTSPEANADTPYTTLPRCSVWPEPWSKTFPRCPCNAWRSQISASSTTPMSFKISAGRFLHRTEVLARGKGVGVRVRVRAERTSAAAPCRPTWHARPRLDPLVQRAKTRCRRRQRATVHSRTERRSRGRSGSRSGCHQESRRRRMSTIPWGGGDVSESGYASADRVPVGGDIPPGLRRAHIPAASGEPS